MKSTLALFWLSAAAIAIGCPVFAQSLFPSPDAARLVTGKAITPLGDHTDVGSYPQSGVLTPDGNFFLVSDSGAVEFLSVVKAADGSLVSQIPYNPPPRERRPADAITQPAPGTPNIAASPAAPPAGAPATTTPAAPISPTASGAPAATGGRPPRGPVKSLYFGIATFPNATGATVYASGGAGGLINILTIDSAGNLTDTGRQLSVPTMPKPSFAGLALSGDGSTLYAADNRGDPGTNMQGTLVTFDTSSRAVKSRIDLPGYPYAVAAITKGPLADQKVYISSEQRGEVTVVNTASANIVNEIPTGMQPIGLLLNADQSKLYVANAGSDTVSVISTADDRVTATVLLRPPTARLLPGATPIALSLSPDQKTLYVTLADMNAIGVVDTASNTVKGYLPTGWYPTGIAATTDGKALMIAEARGVLVRNPTPNIDQPAVPGVRVNKSPLSLLQGVATRIDLSNVDLKAETQQVYENNLAMIRPDEKPFNPGITHVIYIIKENRTYDQVLGDDPRGNGDPAVCMFPKAVTPNLHALADRFVLLDNFYCCAEVSGDGWNWSTAGMASENVSRNVPYNYGGRGRTYDNEGTNNGVPVDLKGIPDVAEPPGGYIWDECAKHGISQRDYGFFSTDVKPPTSDAKVAAEGTDDDYDADDLLVQRDVVTKKVLAAVSDTNFRGFDLTFHDSDAWVKDNLPLPDTDKAAWGAYKEPSRYSEWKREFDQYVAKHNLPQFTMLRLMCDHTGGTRGGGETPRSQVADNDYSVGEVVEAVSKSPYWKSTLILIVEDDAQSGYDHVDCHRSIAFAISPYIQRGLHDSHFYNTDSVLRTIEIVFNLPPMNQYDAIAPPYDIFTHQPDNSEPYTAIMPDKSIIGERNGDDEYGAAWSKKNIDLYDERSLPDIELNEILWRSIMHTDPPAIHHSVQFGPPESNGNG